MVFFMRRISIWVDPPVEKLHESKTQQSHKGVQKQH